MVANKNDLKAFVDTATENIRSKDASRSKNQRENFYQQGVACCRCWRPSWTLSWLFFHDTVGWTHLGEFSTNIIIGLVGLF